ncbi:MAG: hypothetical protein K8S27_02640 [Candidatus Omnitrophica bacterium]|nr:hypothetical protein [Candidatus Omnitrophota bacterium]
MKRSVLACLAVFLGLCLLANNVFAADYRLNVRTNGNVFRQGQILRVEARILNESEKKLKFPGGPIPIPIPFPLEEIKAMELEDAEEQLEAELDKDIVDVTIRPVPIRRTVGYGRLVYLGPKLTNDVHPYPYPYPGKVFRLPRFGSGIVPRHSTSIISLASVYLGPYIYPVPAIDRELAEEVEEIDAVTICPIIRPGYYLLDLFVWDRNMGRCGARAQKVIRIKRRPLLQADVSAEPLPFKLLSQ